MKKKFLLIATGSLSMALAISTIAFATNKNKKDNFVKGGGSPTGFDIDFSTIEHVGDDWTVSLKDNKGSSISITIVGANYDPVEDKFVAKGSGEDFYFYNTDPIRGISYSSFVVNQPHSNQYELVAMLSSNEINLNDALDGYATEDFAYFTGSYYAPGDMNIAMSVDDMPLLANARYFVVHLNPTSEDFSIIDMHLESICEDEVAPKPIIERDGSLSEAEHTQLGEMFAHQLELTKMSHPTWCFSYDGQSIFDSYKVGSTSALITAALDCGFVHTGEIEGYPIYQKKIASTVHSIVTSTISGHYLNTIVCMYMNTLPYLEAEATWPSDYLATVLTPTHAAQIPEFTSSYITGYTYMDNTQAEETQVYIYTTLTPLITEEQISEIVQDFKDLYDAKSGWIKRMETSSMVMYVYEDNYLGATISYNSTVVQFRIQEINPRSETPTSSEIATQMNILHYVDDVVALVGDEHSTYVTNFTTPVPVGKTSCYYTIIDPISGSFETFKGLLEAAGYSVISSGTISYTYGKVVDVYGSYISVNVTVDGPYIRVQYEYNTSIYEYNSLAQALNGVFYVDAVEMCSELVFDDSYEYWGITSSNRRVLVKNAGNELIEQFIANTHLTYIPAYDGYRIDDTSYVLYASINGSNVEIIIDDHSRFEFDDYEDYNTGLNTYIANNGSLVFEDNYVPFVEADNTFESFETDSSDRYYYLGSETEITRVRDLYAERILEKPNFVYSEYLDMYVNTETGFAYELNFKSDEKVSRQYLEIKWNCYVTYKDFDSFNNLHMGDSTFLQVFPTLVDNSRKDEKLFADFSASESDAYVYVKKGDVIENYIDALLDAGFSNVDNRYSKQIGSAVYQVLINEETNAYYVHFFMEDGYQSISDFRSHITAETLAYVDGLGFNSFFTSTTPSYKLDGEGDHILEFKTTKISEAEAYEAYIVSNGFKLDYGHRYIRESGTDVFDIINFEYYGAFCSIRIEQHSVTFNYSWSQLADVLTSRGHDYNFYKNYVCYPDDATGTSFNCSFVSGKGAEFTVSKSYDLEAFDAKCKAHPEFNKVTEYDNLLSYSFKNGSVTVEICDFYYRFYVYCPLEKPIDPTGAIPVSLGETPISITGEVKYFEFTASEDGRYDITTISGVDTYGYLYDENGIKITSNDDGGDNGNFLIEAKLQAGKTYYIGVRLFSSGEEDVTLSITYKGL